MKCLVQAQSASSLLAYDRAVLLARAAHPLSGVWAVRRPLASDPILFPYGLV